MSAKLIVGLSLLASSHCFAQSSDLLTSFTAPWNTLIFVSTQMPRNTLISLAKEASAAHAVIVLTGFSGPSHTVTDTEKFALEINNVCCGKTPARWVIDPVYTRRFKVTAAPTFVIAHGESENPAEFSKIAGDFSLAQALKFFAQRSQIPAVQGFAAKTYYSAYGTKY